MRDAVNLDINPICNPDEVHDLNKPLPFDNDYFEEVFALEIFEHIPNGISLIREINRVLKPNGILVVAVPYHGFLKNILVALFTFDFHFNPFAEHVRFYTKRTLSCLFRKGGFRITKTEYIGRFKPIASTIKITGVKT